MTDRQTDQANPFITIGRIYAVLLSSLKTDYIDRQPHYYAVVRHKRRPTSSEHRVHELLSRQHVVVATKQIGRRGLPVAHPA